MEPINVGIFSILPPVIAIGLALFTKEVVSSLFIGILSGAFIYNFHTWTGGITSLIVGTGNTAVQLMIDKLSGNISIVMFLAMLGILVVTITKAGGSKAYGDWASSKIKTRSGACLATSALGAFIFIDDYFNCLTVGTVMRPVTDKYKISHAKLAYLIDATAAPICIIAPISSWAASVISQMDNTGLKGMQSFISTIPFNLYALLTVVMIFAVSLLNIDFGPMEKFEDDAKNHNRLDSLSANEEQDELKKLKISPNGKVFDLLFPILVLIILSVFSMLYVGGYFNGGMTLAEGFGNTDAGTALSLSSFGTLLFTFFLFVPRKILSFQEFMDSVSQGVKSMVGAIIILTFAWTISGICRDLLSTGEYVGNLVANSQMPTVLIPCIIFAVAGFLSFAMGTSWGTFGILIPIIVIICNKVAPELTIISLSATLAGSVFGDHCSPISDTTILSSTGANCNHMNHVASQIPYAVLVAVCCEIGYLVAGITQNLILTWAFSFTATIILLFLLHQYTLKKRQKKLS